MHALCISLAHTEYLHLEQCKAVPCVNKVMVSIITKCVWDLKGSSSYN
jgi:hypothetical protein